ncbi:hypothetical protein QMA61_15050 [Streptomyces coelicoflavus]|uniref:hypothetical protein n=1 Tax=Streptomyces coelicoflavus TaxID=285562 RepID=UPI0024ADFFA2|nr:hypothetical protein [Streptomyces coelicoflavus]MDI6517515.1 hypothetical protein [Streptomyces coelicoflavus]
MTVAVTPRVTMAVAPRVTVIVAPHVTVIAAPSVTGDRDTACDGEHMNRRVIVS